MSAPTPSIARLAKRLIAAGALTVAAGLLSSALTACEPTEACDPACNLGFSCEDGQCVQGDGSCSPACSVGFACSAGQCVPADQVPGGGGPSPRAVGAACTTTADCDTGACFPEPSFPGGYCSEICGGQVIASGAQCPAGSACVQLGQASAACVDTCASGDDCRAGYACKSIQGVSVCYPGCSSNAECPTGAACNTSTGICESGYVAPGAVGAGCAADGECGAGQGVCLSEAATQGGFPGGYCTLGCADVPDGSFCPNQEGLCAHIPQDDGSVVAACFRNCSSAVDCRPGYACSTSIGVVGEGNNGVCVPACRAGTCESGWTCDTVSGFCVEGSGGGATGPGQVSTQPLGTVQIGPNDTEFQAVSVDVPAGTTSFSIIAKPNPPIEVVPIKITTPQGQVVYDYFNPMATDYKVLPALNKAYFSLTYPNSPRLELTPGRYEVLLGAQDKTSAKVDAVFKTVEGVPQEGQLPVVLWFTQNSVLNAASAQSDPAFQQAMQGFVDIYASVGIAVGPITYQDIPEPMGTALAVVDEEEFDDFFTVADGSDLPGLNFFFCEQFNFGGGGLLGMSGGIPGPPSVQGLPHGGVAVALAFLQQDPHTFAETIAHEGGHYLGLYHLSERDGKAHDPLLDTPECAAQLDQNGDAIVDGYECYGSGDDYLMFWTPGGRPQRTLSPEQKWVLLRNPAVQ